MDKVEDVIELLESIKNWTDPVTDEHPFGTVDYMQIDSAIEFLRGLTKRAADGFQPVPNSNNLEVNQTLSAKAVVVRRRR